jgi:hypothetical protein
MADMDNPNPNTPGGSKSVIIIAVVLLVLSLPCCAGLFLIGGGAMFYSVDVQQVPEVSTSPEEKPPDDGTPKTSGG